MSAGSAQLESQAELWLLRTDLPREPGQAERDSALLDRDDHQRAARLRRPADRERSVLAHAFLRRCLSRSAPVAPEGWRFRRDDHGRPWVTQPAGHGLFFSLSHCRGLCAVLVSPHPDCGVDVERLDALRDPLTLARHAFSSEERAVLEAAEGADRQRAFTARWTLKEAWAKARGLGMELPFHEAAFHLEPDGGVRASFPSALDHAERWRFLLVEPTPHHLLAVALGGGGAWELSVHGP